MTELPYDRRHRYARRAAQLLVLAIWATAAVMVSQSSHATNPDTAWLNIIRAVTENALIFLTLSVFAIVLAAYGYNNDSYKRRPTND